MGLAVNDIENCQQASSTSDDRLSVRQVKTVRYHRVLALPEYGKIRDVPLPTPVRAALAEHLRDFPAVPVALPWNVHGGDDVAQTLIVTSMRSLAVAANDFNRNYWKPALDACGVPSGRYENGMHDLRHFFASKLLEQGVSIKAVAEWLGTPIRRSRSPPTPI